MGGERPRPEVRARVGRSRSCDTVAASSHLPLGLDEPPPPPPQKESDEAATGEGSGAVAWPPSTLGEEKDAAAAVASAPLTELLDDGDKENGGAEPPPDLARLLSCCSLSRMASSPCALWQGEGVGIGRSVERSPHLDLTPVGLPEHRDAPCALWAVEDLADPRGLCVQTASENSIIRSNRVENGPLYPRIIAITHGRQLFASPGTLETGMSSRPSSALMRVDLPVAGDFRFQNRNPRELPGRWLRACAGPAPLTSLLLLIVPHSPDLVRARIATLNSCVACRSRRPRNWR